MQISAPIYRLKRQARLLAREQRIPLYRALDSVAVAEGFRSWSHLAATVERLEPADAVLAQLQPGDLVLLGARPGHGKTSLGLELASKAAARGLHGYFFTLDYHEGEVAALCQETGGGQDEGPDRFTVDTSDDISGDYIIERMRSVTKPALVVVDYLQLLDQRRVNRPLAEQVDALAGYAERTGAICVLISQIDRRFELSGKRMPELSDVRLPNPVPLSAFDVTCFMHDGELEISRAA